MARKPGYHTHIRNKLVKLANETITGGNKQDATCALTCAYYCHIINAREYYALNHAIASAYYSNKLPITYCCEQTNQGVKNLYAATLRACVESYSNTAIYNRDTGETAQYKHVITKITEMIRGGVVLGFISESEALDLQKGVDAI